MIHIMSNNNSTHSESQSISSSGSSSMNSSPDQYPNIEPVHELQTIHIEENEDSLLGGGKLDESNSSKSISPSEQFEASVSRIKSVLNYFQNLHPSKHHSIENYFKLTSYSIDQLKLDYLVRIDEDDRNRIRKYLNENRCRQAVPLRDHFEFYFSLKSSNLTYAWCMCLFQHLFDF